MPRIRAYKVSCDQCQMVSINGVACHEHGCPNSQATWDAETQSWQRYSECFECGCEVFEGESCGCMVTAEMEEV